MSDQPQVQVQEQKEIKHPDPREYWQGFPEAPFSDSFKWIDTQGFEHLSTVRGWQFSTLLTTIQRATAHIAEIGGLPPSKVVIAPPQATIPVRDENGTPVVDGNTGQPVMTTLPQGVRLYQVSGLAHDKTKNSKDVLKVWTVEEPYNKGYGVSCFHPPAEIGAWKSWPLMSRDNKVRYGAPIGFTHVLIRDPQKDGGYPDVLEFRA